MSIGILGAMESEVQELIDNMEQKAEHKLGPATFWQGEISGVDCVVVRSGIGKVAMAATAQAMIDNFGLSLLINTGVAGALDERLRVGDVVVATDVVMHDVDVSALGYPAGALPGQPLAFTVNHQVNALLESELARLAPNIQVLAGRIASGDQFVNTPEQRARIRRIFDARACEMEGAALALVCHMNNVDCCVLRAISDSVDGGGATEYTRFEKEAAHTMASLLLDALPNVARALGAKS